MTGNLLPILLSAPFLVAGIQSFPGHGLTWPLVAFPVAAWLATNLLGLAGSWGLKSEMGKRLHQERPFDKTERTFVGFARPGYQGLLDPHEDVGFLILHPDWVEFFGAASHVELKKADVQSVRFRPNVHTWVGLGRWVSIEGSCEGKPVRLLVECRERPTLLGNLLLGTRLRKRLAEWVSS